MKRNVGSIDRAARGVAALALLTYAAVAPLPLHLRVLALAVPAAYLLFTALAGRCLGYRLLGRSTCPAPRS
jgi:hypothetical protein